MDLASTPRARVARVRTAALRTTIGLAVGAALVIAFLRLVNVGAVYQRLQHLDISSALLCSAAFLSAYVVRGLRWRCLLWPCRVRIRTAVAIYQVAIFLNWLLPIRGGEIAMSLLLRHSNGIPVSRSLAAVSMDKAMDLLPVVALLAVLPFVPLHLSSLLWLLLLSALAVVGFGAAVLVLAAWRRERGLALLVRPVARLMPEGARERIEAFIVVFVDALLALIRQPRVLLVAAMYTIIALCLDALFCLFAFRAVGVVVPVPVVLYGYTFFNLAFILPSPPGQVGSNELIGLLIFSGSFGISRSGVGAMFLFSHPWTALLMACTGLACLSGMGLTMRSTLRLTREEKEPEGEGRGKRAALKGSNSKTHDSPHPGNGSRGLPRRSGDRFAADARLAAPGADLPGRKRDDQPACGGDFYARGHIRATARAVGADPEPLIQQYDTAQSGADRFAAPTEYAAPDQFGPDQFGPDQFGPDQFGPEESGTGGFGAPEEFGPGRFTVPVYFGSGRFAVPDEDEFPASDGFPAPEEITAPIPVVTTSQIAALDETPEEITAPNPVMTTSQIAALDKIMAAGPATTPAGTPPPRSRPAGPAGGERPGRTDRIVVAAVALALAIFGGLAYLLVSGSRTVPHADPAVTPRTTPSAATPRSAPPVTLIPVRAVAFGPGGAGDGDNPQRASLAIDGRPRTAWQTDWYTTSHFGNLQAGTGLLLDMGHRVTITRVQITLGSMAGAAVQLRAGNSAVLAGLRPVANAGNARGTVRLRLARPARARYVLIWFTRLPPDPAGTYQANIYNVRLR